MVMGIRFKHSYKDKQPSKFVTVSFSGLGSNTEIIEDPLPSIVSELVHGEAEFGSINQCMCLPTSRGRQHVKETKYMLS